VPAYLIADIEVTDPTRYEEYKGLAAASVAEFGGTYVVRGGAAETLEGNWIPARVVVLRFPSLDQARAWWDSDRYAPAKALRHAAATSRMILVEGT
jgi:uncharacterized protein (DUF1330 family)